MRLIFSFLKNINVKLIEEVIPFVNMSKFPPKYLAVIPLEI